MQNIKANGFDGANEAFIDEGYFRAELQGHDVKSHDLLIAGLGDENNVVGRACVAPIGIEPAMVKADCFRFRIDTKKLLPRFAALYLSASAEADAGFLSSGSTRARISLSARVAGFDALVLESQRAIDLLLERRTTLISAAVTGQINVRQLDAEHASTEVAACVSR